jgi:hypothetical protein
MSSSDKPSDGPDRSDRSDGAERRRLRPSGGYRKLRTYQVAGHRAKERGRDRSSGDAAAFRSAKAHGHWTPQNHDLTHPTDFSQPSCLNNPAPNARRRTASLPCSQTGHRCLDNGELARSIYGVKVAGWLGAGGGGSLEWFSARVSQPGQQKSTIKWFESSLMLSIARISFKELAATARPGQTQENKMYANTWTVYHLGGIGTLLPRDGAIARGS